ncbi:MAG: hypothetical protein JWR10_1464 [Rubritepida sp.]|nr:hypothetical protein [Rubritepida sp.]
MRQNALCNIRKLIARANVESPEDQGATDMSVSAEQERNYRAVMERKLDIAREESFTGSDPAQRLDYGVGSALPTARQAAAAK